MANLGLQALLTLVRHLGPRSPLVELRGALLVEQPYLYSEAHAKGSCDDLVTRFGGTLARLDLTNWGMHGVALLDRLLRPAPHDSPRPVLQSITAWPACAQLPLSLLGKRCPALQRISVARTTTSHVTDAGVAALAVGCRNLVNVDFHRCQSLTDGSLHLLATHCGGLRRIGLKGCYQLSPLQTAALIAALPNLEEADLSIGDNALPAFGDGTATSTSVSTISRAFLSSTPPHTCRMLCSTWYAC